MRLYHNTNQIISSIDECTLLDGIMLHERPTNAQCTYSVELDKDDILTSFVLSYFYNQAALLKLLKSWARPEADIDRVYAIVVEEAPLELSDYYHINAAYPHMTYILLETQRLRGKLAQALGFTAVECGTNILLVKSAGSN